MVNLSASTPSEAKAIERWVQALQKKNARHHPLVG